MMHLKRKSRGSRLPLGRWLALRIRSTWACTRWRTTPPVIFSYRSKRDLLATRTRSCHPSVVLRPACRLTICNNRILIVSRTFYRMTQSVGYRGLTSAAKDRLLWSLKVPQSLRVKVAPHFEVRTGCWTADLLTCPWHAIWYIVHRFDIQSFREGTLIYLIFYFICVKDQLIINFLFLELLFKKRGKKHPKKKSGKHSWMLLLLVAMLSLVFVHYGILCSFGVLVHVGMKGSYPLVNGML